MPHDYPKAMPLTDRFILRTDLRDSVALHKQDLLNIKKISHNQCEVTFEYNDGSKKTFITDTGGTTINSW